MWVRQWWDGEPDSVTTDEDMRRLLLGTWEDDFVLVHTPGRIQQYVLLDTYTQLPTVWVQLTFDFNEGGKPVEEEKRQRLNEMLEDLVDKAMDLQGLDVESARALETAQAVLTKAREFVAALGGDPDPETS